MSARGRKRRQAVQKGLAALEEGGVHRLGQGGENVFERKNTLNGVERLVVGGGLQDKPCPGASSAGEWRDLRSLHVRGLMLTAG